jgi:hypothetical protein
MSGLVSLASETSTSTGAGGVGLVVLVGLILIFAGSSGGRR